MFVFGRGRTDLVQSKCSFVRKSREDPERARVAVKAAAHVKD